MYFLYVWIIWILLLVVYHVVHLPPWLASIATLEFAIPLALGLNILDFWTTKICVKKSPYGTAEESNPIARYVVRLGPVYNVLFKLVIVSAILILIVLLQNAALTLALISLLILVVINNSLAICFLPEHQD